LSRPANALKEMRGTVEIEEKEETPITYCPHCNANLRGEPIPENIAHHYSGTHWGRRIGIYDFELDRVVKWECPDCHGTWERKWDQNGWLE